MKAAFITTNEDKFREAIDALKGTNLELEMVDMEYAENHDDSIKKIAEDAAKELSIKLKKTVIVEDTGLFFEAYNNFPGALPKFVYKNLGFKGIMKLLEGERRGAYFKAIVAYGTPGEKPILFEGIMKGTISDTVADEEAGKLPYDKIFIPIGEDRVISKMTLAEKNKISHRAKAFKRLAEYLSLSIKNTR